MRRAVAAVAATALVTALAACTGEDDPGGSSGPTTPAASSTSTSTSTPGPATPDPATGGPELDAAVSEPVEDSVYPDVGDPGVDALHYDLQVTWDPRSDLLTGEETLVFRATDTADEFRLDLAEPLEVSEVRVGDDEVDYEHDGKDLVVALPVEADRRYAVTLRYRGTPEPVPAPSTRDDTAGGLGLTIDDEHQVWTMQEPYGAFTWYAVNDQPADKAFYDFTLETSTPFTGVANGEQVTDEIAGGTRRTAYHLAEPAAAYLVTVAFGDYRRTEDTGPHDLPITYWTFTGDPVPEGLRSAPRALAWLEERLGPYPFDRAGVLLVDSTSGMETQTLITLGDDPGATTEATVLHELAHQWYGDQVTPADWRDVWMNEGMAMYLQLLWEAEQEGVDDDTYLASYADLEAGNRAEAGPPGDYDPRRFAAANVYFSGAFLWHAVRARVDDDDRFWEVVRGWPASQDNRSTDRESLLAYLEEQTGQDLDDLWDDWLLGRTSPELPSVGS